MGDSSKKSDSVTPSSEANHPTPSMHISAVEEMIEHSKAHWSTLSDISDHMEGEELGDSSKKSDSVTPSSEANHPTPSMYISAVEEMIEHSKAHWSTLWDISDHMEGEELVSVAMRNEQEFRALQMHPTWGSFFANFTGDGISTGIGDVLGELIVGKKFAEGGQAELFDAQIKWNDPLNTEIDRSYKHKHVVKVFHERDLLGFGKLRMPQGLMQHHADVLENRMSLTTKRLPRVTSHIYCMVLLKNGRFASLMRKELFDLRSQIERNMKLRSDKDCGPFSKEEAEFIMYTIALGLDWLHNRDIVHRDVKASNVLVAKTGYRWPRLNYLLADYETSIGVLGTGFFRAPEILQVCKERKVNEKPEVFSKAADVYSYGMTCYEILTGNLPFEYHPLNRNPSLMIDLVIDQHLRPQIPYYIEDTWALELLRGCWQSDPTTRPKIGEILNVLSANSAIVRKYEALF